MMNTMGDVAADVVWAALKPSSSLASLEVRPTHAMFGESTQFSSSLKEQTGWKPVPPKDRRREGAI